MRIFSRVRGMAHQEQRGKLWGYFHQIAGQVAPVVTFVNFGMLAVTVGAVTSAPIWAVLFLMMMLLVVASLIAFKWGLPSHFAVVNEQQYKHDNPIRRDLVIVDKKLNLLLKHTPRQESPDIDLLRSLDPSLETLLIKGGLLNDDGTIKSVGTQKKP